MHSLHAFEEQERESAHIIHSLDKNAPEFRVSLAVRDSCILSNSEKREILMSPYARPEYFKAEEIKEEANKALQEEQLDKAIELYTQAVEMCPRVKEFHSNRSEFWCLVLIFCVVTP